MRPRPLACTAILALVSLLAACGNERSRPSGLAKLGNPTNFISYTSPTGDVSFGRPASWTVIDGQPPEVAELSSGSAVAAIYSYPRADLPHDPAAVEASRQRLLESLHRRAPSFRVESHRVATVDDAPAVEIVGRGRIAGRPVKTRSVHVYKGLAEYVIDAYSRPAYFERANRIAFEPLLATIRLGGLPDEATGSRSSPDSPTASP